MRNMLARFICEDEGQDLIEYALLTGIITTGVILIIGGIGTKVHDYFSTLNGLLVP